MNVHFATLAYPTPPMSGSLQVLRYDIRHISHPYRGRCDSFSPVLRPVHIKHCHSQLTSRISQTPYQVQTYLTTSTLEVGKLLSKAPTIQLISHTHHPGFKCTPSLPPNIVIVEMLSYKQAQDPGSLCASAIACDARPDSDCDHDQLGAHAIERPARQRRIVARPAGRVAATIRTVVQTVVIVAHVTIDHTMVGDATVGEAVSPLLVAVLGPLV